MEGVGIMADLQQTFYKKAHQNKMKIMLARIILFIGILIIWEVTTRLHIIDAFIFSSPSRIIKTFISMLKNGEILYHTSVTLLETLISFALIVVLGISIPFITCIINNAHISRGIHTRYISFPFIFIRR